MHQTQLPPRVNDRLLEGRCRNDDDLALRDLGAALVIAVGAERDQLESGRDFGADDVVHRLGRVTEVKNAGHQSR
jgi:hypothetical protein